MDIKTSNQFYFSDKLTSQNLTDLYRQTQYQQDLFLITIILDINMLRFPNNSTKCNVQFLSF